MTEQRELSELKHEVVEARNQAIKTDNQVKNLSFDVKSFEKRFDSLEARVRLSSIGLHLIVAVSIVASAYMVHALRVKVFEKEISSLQEAVREEHQAAQDKSDALASKLDEERKRRDASEQAATRAESVLALIERHQDKEAVEGLEQIDANHLTALERRFCAPRFDELKRRQAEALYRQGRRKVAEGHGEAAIPDLRGSLALDKEGRFAGQARYQLGWALWNSHQYADAEGVARELCRHTDGTVVDEAHYMLATSLTRLGRTEEGKRLFGELVQQESRFAGAARAYLAALESGGELPQDLPNGRIRLARRVP